MALNDAFAPAPGAQPTPEVPRIPVPAVIAHLTVFASLAWYLSIVPALSVLFDDLGVELPIPALVLMTLNRMFAAVGLPLWVLAVLGLAADAGVCASLRRKGRYRAAENWLWLVAGAVIPGTILVQQVLHMPLVSLIHSMK